MHREIELCLALDPRNLKRFLAWPVLAQPAPASEGGPPAPRQGAGRQLRAVYFDTNEGHLAERRMALRLRRATGRWEQTFKRQRPGLVREEWTHRIAAVPGAPGSATAVPALDPLGFPPREHPSGKWLQDRLADLAAVFETRVQRRSWRIEPEPGALVEVVLDRGKLVAGAREETLCEVEIELLEGPERAVWQAALALLDWVPCRVQPRSKGERGYRLAGHAAPVASGRPRLAARPDSLGALIRAGMEWVSRELASHAAVLIEGDDPEGPHQVRVQLRRLRALLRLATSELTAPAWQRVRQEARWLAREVAELRDLDVLRLETVEPIRRCLPEDAALSELVRCTEAARALARVRARRAIASVRAQRLLLEIGALAHAAIPAADALPVRPTVTERLTTLEAKVDKRARKASTDEARHALRLAYKNLRYMAEWARAADADGKRVKRTIAHATRAQLRLGQSQDAVVALERSRQLLAEVDAGLRERALGLLQGWLLAQLEND
ncbi:MAG: CHAD domain-containing protein [Burkholderiales bacterium]|nr:MAG: CHAD domain-containing protein [Burkholderiales bacterium]